MLILQSIILFVAVAFTIYVFVKAVVFSSSNAEEIPPIAWYLPAAFWAIFYFLINY